MKRHLLISIDPVKTAPISHNVTVFLLAFETCTNKKEGEKFRGAPPSEKIRAADSSSSCSSPLIFRNLLSLPHAMLFRPTQFRNTTSALSSWLAHVRKPGGASFEIRDTVDEGRIKGLLSTLDGLKGIESSSSNEGCADFFLSCLIDARAYSSLHTLRTQRDILSPGYSLLLFPPYESSTSSLGLDGTERGLHHPPTDPITGIAMERMWVGGKFTFPSSQSVPQEHNEEAGSPLYSSIALAKDLVSAALAKSKPQDLVIGDSVICRNIISSVVEKSGKDGRKGYYVTQTREIRKSGEEEVRIEEVRTHLYRNPQSSSTPSPTAPPPSRTRSPTPSQTTSTTKLNTQQNHSSLKADFEIPFLFTPLHLFRFSALTFNTHRIHWDESYAVGIEGREGKSMFSATGEEASNALVLFQASWWNHLR